MPIPYLPSSCCRLSCSLRRACLLAMRAGLSGSGTAVGDGLVDMTAPPAAHKVERVEHVDHGAGINVAHQLDNVLALVGRNNGVQQVHLFAAVSADDLGAANAVLKMVYVAVMTSSALRVVICSVTRS